MLARKIYVSELNEALAEVNKRYQNNIRFRDIRHEGKSKGGGLTYRFTLTVVSSQGPGHRLGLPHSNGKQRRIAAACWHVHGHFFDHLFSLNPKAVIVLGGGQKITKDQGNWKDRNIGSMIQPMYFSDACEC